MEIGKPGNIPVALTIAGSDSGGGAGIQADLKSFAAVKVHGTSAITSITAQNTTEVRASQDVRPEIIIKQIKAVMEDIGIDAAKTGMLHTSKIITAVAKGLKNYDFPVVVDPVMIAKSGATLLKEEAMGALQSKIIPQATVVTPNRFEAEKLTNTEIETLEDAKKAAKQVLELGCSAVVVKGGHITTEDKSTDVFYQENGKIKVFEKPRIDTSTDHGTGCSFSASIAAYLAKGYSIAKAVEKAKDLVWLAIKHGIPVGKGHGPVNPLAILYRELGKEGGS